MRTASIFALLLLTGTLGFARESLPEPVTKHDSVSQLLDKRFLRLASSGQAALTFSVAVGIIHEDDFLNALQIAYAEMLPEGESPEFTVQQTAPGNYAYVNRDGEKTTITEILRVIESDRVELYIFSTGNRFFGSFEALTAITVKPDTDESVLWDVKVFAYPRNLVSRIVARTGVVNRFFRNKTTEITELAVQIGAFLTRPGSG